MLIPSSSSKGSSLSKSSLEGEEVVGAEDIEPDKPCETKLGL